MYFDLRKYLQIIRAARSSTSPKARRTALSVLAALPMVTAFHAACFRLDPLLFPGLQRQRLRAPIFIIGHARSGTTFMHRLLTKDSQRFSYFLFYELFFPSLLQKKAIRWLGALDRALLHGGLGRRIAARDEAAFAFSQDLHATGLLLPDEDDTVLVSSCASGFWNVLVPLMDQVDFYYLDEQPAEQRRRVLDQYDACVRRQLELTGGEIHLSKNPTFCGRVKSLIERYPDARFILMMRSPYETVPSLLSLLSTVWKKEGWEEEKRTASLRRLAEQSIHTYRYPLQVLEQHPEVKSAIVDYRDLIAHPRRTVEDVYRKLDLPVSPPLAAALAEEERRQRGRESQHRYSLAEFGLAPVEIRDALADLFQRFGWDAPADSGADVYRNLEL